uniref:4-coumarate--CoA ligase 1-like isoform X1 n=1 Tax=Styela clava TaxID=7725 RepID=UPI001939EEFD|nr:4-coumarate--CoA ligase 1-like isoform X1 [Styela clava]
MPIKSPFPDFDIPPSPLGNYMLTQMKKYGDRIATVNLCDGSSATYSQLYARSKSCASALRKQGLRKGDVISILSLNTVNYPAIMIGAFLCGGTIAPCNPWYTKDEILQQYRIYNPKMVFVADTAVDKIKEIKNDIPSIEKIFVIGQKMDDFVSLSEMIKNTDDDNFDDVDINTMEDISILASSSGTTGPPKCVMHTYRSLMTATFFRKLRGIDLEGKTYYHDRPIFHTVGYTFTLGLLHYGAKIIFDQTFDAVRMLKAVETYKVDHSFISPSAMLILAQTHSSHNYDISSLKTAVFGGASVAPSVLCSVKEKYGIKVYASYGLTECTPVAINYDLDNFIESNGCLSPNTVIKIVDLQSGEEKQCKQSGEILVKGPHMMKGYLNNPEATRNAITDDGFLRTGDIGYCDENGMLYVVGRIKEVIKYKGLQVPPVEIESVLLTHEKIADAGVIGLPDKECGEIPKAFIVKNDESLTEDEVVKFVASKLTYYKHLRGGVEFIVAIPKSTFGKIQRNELKKLAKLIP